MNRHSKLFLVTYDRERGDAVVEEVVGGSGAATRLYEARERELGGQEHVEVVLLGSESLETLKRTHSSYFGAGAGLGAMLAGARD